jgi:hypothetical protein
MQLLHTPYTAVLQYYCTTVACIVWLLRGAAVPAIICGSNSISITALL